ncbi:OmpH family outer membrane protein [Sneathiella sp.]|uniref:OmpH family outer membrane protein n=1 Tax=Sneathiella sp. TaxID=1964365 RepID=UPI003564A2E9
MMLIRYLPIVLFLTILTVFSAPQSYAQSGAKTYIGVLDMQKIMSELAVVKDINDQLKGIENKYKTEIEAQEQKLRDEKVQIERQKSVIAPNAYTQKQAEFNKKAEAHRLEIQSKNRQIQKSRMMALDQVRSQLLPVMQQMMTEYGATVILDINEILFVEKPLDLTDKVFAALDKQLKKVDVKVIPSKQN